ncbi:MAG: outer membrane beta-barrel protein, partial [Sulfuritalea sp.]|nr:outer membrane beta-barrel protein [Sulfuritalea sp.]
GARGDLVAQTAVGLTLDKPVGRQVLRGGIGLTQIRHGRHTQLDSELSSHSAGWDWSLGNRLTGALSYHHAEKLPGFGDFRTPVRDVVKTDSITARATVRIPSGWQLQLGAGHTRTAHSASVNAFGDSRVESVETGLRYAPGSGREFGLRLRQAEGSFPNRQQVGGHFIDNSYRENALELDAVWHAGGTSQLQGAIGSARRNYGEVAERNFSGLTGRLNWNWRPTGRTSLGAGIRRETGSQDDLIATQAVSDVISASAAWQPTAKLGFNILAELRQRDLRADPLPVPGSLSNRRDDDELLSLGVGYAAMRDLRLNLSWREERRKSSFAAGTYRARLIAVAATFVF